MSIKSFWQKICGDENRAEETEFLPAVLEITETPPSPVGRLVLWSLMALVAAALIWAVLGKIDEVAVANGKIIPTGQVKIVQAEDKGIVKKIYVKDGEYVKKGQPLIELDPTVSGADLARLKKQLAYYKLDIARLQAQMADAPFVPFASADLEQNDITAQQQLYNSSISQYRAQREAAEMKVSQNEAAVQSAVAQKEKYIKMLAISRDKESRLKKLMDDEAVAQFDYLNEKSNRVNYEMTVQSLIEEINKAEAELAESRKNLANVTASYRKEIMTQLVDSKKAFYDFQEELKKAEEKKKLATIKAPCDGRVNQLSIHTVGGIVTAAQGLMMIVPDNVQMVVEAWADNKDIGFIRLGQEAEIKVATFNFQKFGIVHGKVAEISPDAMEDDRDPETDKKYRLILTLEKSRMLVNSDKVALTPGMAVTAEIKIKQKRIIEFFLDPFRKYQNEALRER